MNKESTREKWKNIVEEKEEVKEVKKKSQRKLTLVLIRIISGRSHKSLDQTINYRSNGIILI